MAQAKGDMDRFSEMTPQEQAAMRAWLEARGQPLPHGWVSVAMTPCQRRAALVVQLLASQASVSKWDVADVVGLSPDGAYRLIIRLSRVIPVYQVSRGRWACC